VTADPRDETKWAKLLEAELIGRPVGAKAWVEGLEEPFNRTFSPQKRGPKPRTGRDVETGGLFDI
jgi:putative transposase